MAFCPKCGSALKPSTEPQAPSPPRIKRYEEEARRDILGLVSFGFFLISIGVVFLTSPNLISEISVFFRDFQLKELWPNVFLPAPTSNHPVLYGAIETFCYIFGIFQVGMLILRFAYRSSASKRAGTASNIVFWLGAGYLLGILKDQTIGWFSFIAGLIILIGICVIIRSIITLAMAHK
jgi:predicted ferric reductase